MGDTESLNVWRQQHGPIPPANSPNIISRLVCLDESFCVWETDHLPIKIFNKKQMVKTLQKSFLSFAILANCSLSRSLQSTFFRVCRRGQTNRHTDIATYRLKTSLQNVSFKSGVMPFWQQLLIYNKNIKVIRNHKISK